MKKSEVYKIYKEELNAFLAEQGFKYKKDRFIRQQSYGFDAVIPDIKDYNPKFYLEIAIQIRIDIVENIKSQFNEDFRSRTNLHLSTTWGGGNVLKDLGDLVVYNESDIKLACDKIKYILVEKGYDSFRKYSNIGELYTLYKGGMIKNQIVFPQMAMTTIILSKLANDPQYPELVGLFRSKINPDYPNGFPAYDKLVEYLQTVEPVYDITTQQEINKKS